MALPRRMSQARCGRGRVGPRLFAGDQPVVDMTPVIRRGVCGIDAERLDLLDRLQNTADFRPAADAEQDFAARADEGQRRVGLRPA